MMPAVSICIPTCNQAEFTSQALENVVRQTFEDVEIVVCISHRTEEAKDMFKNQRSTSKSSGQQQ